jgi:hypothetical protein
MNDEKRELTLGEQRYMERMREAEEEGMSLNAYYRAHGLSLNMLYKVRRQLVQKGILPPSRKPQEAQSAAGKWAAIHVTGVLGPPGIEAGAVCRLRHPSGWLIECGMWPEPRWLAGLMEVHL